MYKINVTYPTKKGTNFVIENLERDGSGLHLYSILTTRRYKLEISLISAELDLDYIAVNIFSELDSKLTDIDCKITPTILHTSIEVGYTSNSLQLIINPPMNTAFLGGNRFKRNGQLYNLHINARDISEHAIKQHFATNLNELLGIDEITPYINIQNNFYHEEQDEVQQ